MTPKQKKMLLTFLATGLGAVTVEHFWKPGLKRKLGV